MQSTLKGARVSAEIMVKDVAKEMGVTNQTVYNWERGISEPSIKNLIKLCEMYGITLNDIKWK